MRKLFYLVVLLLLCATSVFAQHTYYISISAGADTNTSTQAQSKATPWAHVPGMATATSNLAAYTVVAGDNFVLMGCDNWGNSNFPITWVGNGTSGNLITIGGTDQTWYNTSNCPSSWNRPIFDYGGSPLSTGASNNTMIKMVGYSYVQWSWIEHKGHNWTSSTASGFQQNGCITTSGSGVIIDHWYVHGWTHTGGATADSFQCFSGSTTSPFNSGSLLEYNVFDGSDSTNAGDSGAFMYVWPNAKYNVINDGSNGVYGPLGINGGEVGYNRITNINQSFDGTVHENCIEILIGAGNNGTFYIHDNFLQNCIGEMIMLGNTGETDYVWNNILTGNMGNMIHMPQNSNPGVSMYFWNNTLVPRTGLNCFLIGSFTWSGVVQAENNHCITSAAGGSYSGLANSAWSATGGVTVSSNLVQTPTTATSQGYTSSQSPYIYYPTVGGSTIGAGANLTSSWPGGYVTSDTTYACSESTVSGVVESVCPARTSNTRPTGSTAWDIGAYEFGSQASSPSCSPASGTYSSTQHPACTNPNSGTTVQCYATGGTTPATNGLGTACTTGTLLASGGTVTVAANVTLNLIAGTSTLADSPVTSYTYYIQASPATCSPTSGNVPQTVTCTNPNSGTTIACYNTTGSPATNGLGTGCAAGSTAYTTSLSVSSPETLYIVAGTSTLSDSTVNSYTYGAASNVAPCPSCFALLELP